MSSQLEEALKVTSNLGLLNEVVALSERIPDSNGDPDFPQELITAMRNVVYSELSNRLEIIEYMESKKKEQNVKLSSKKRRG